MSILVTWVRNDETITVILDFVELAMVRQFQQLVNAHFNVPGSRTQERIWQQHLSPLFRASELLLR